MGTLEVVGIDVVFVIEGSVIEERGREATRAKRASMPKATVRMRVLFFFSMLGSMTDEPF